MEPSKLREFCLITPLNFYFLFFQRLTVNASSPTNPVEMLTLSTTTVVSPPLIFGMLESGKSTPTTGTLAMVALLLAVRVPTWNAHGKSTNGVATPGNYGLPVVRAVPAALSKERGVFERISV
jgi:hypothetical protein